MQKIKDLLKNNLFIYSAVVTAISIVTIIILVAILGHYIDKARGAYDQGQTDIRMEVEQKMNEAVDVIKSIKLPPKKTELYKQEFNNKGELHSNIVNSAGLLEFVINNCDKATQQNFEKIKEYAIQKNISTELVFAIAWADTQCGKYLTTPNNYGNVNNNDRGNRVGYFTALDGWKAIVDTLNNKYIGQNSIVGQLSGGGRKAINATYDCSNAIMGYKCYATSEYNWNKNVLRALTVMSGHEANENWEIRL